MFRPLVPQGSLELLCPESLLTLLTAEPGAEQDAFLHKREPFQPSCVCPPLVQTFKQQGSTVLKLGDTVIPYHDDFKMYITTKLPNPHYSPEVSTKLTLINFTLSPRYLLLPHQLSVPLSLILQSSDPQASCPLTCHPHFHGFCCSGLEDQLLGEVVAAERPDLEEDRNQLIISNAQMRQELKVIEDQILYRLSTSEGNPVDDLELIKVLEASKLKAGEIQVRSERCCSPCSCASPNQHSTNHDISSVLQAKVAVAEQTEKDINITRMQYVPVAVRSQILYFCVSDLSNVDPMYQYSLEWFLNIFLLGIRNSEKAGACPEQSSPLPSPPHICTRSV